MLSKFSCLLLVAAMAFLILVMNFKSRKIYSLLRYLTANFRQRANRREERKLAAVFLLMVAANSAACVLDFDLSAYAFAPNLMTLLCVAQRLFQFTAVTNILRTKLKVINSERYLTRNIFNYLHVRTYICELIQEVNSLFNQQLLAIMLTEFFHIVCSMCYLIQHIRAIHFYNLFLHMFTVFYIIIKACYTTQYQIFYSGRMIVNFIVSRKNPELNQNLDYVLECLSYNSKPFSLYQLISLDLSVLVSIFGAVTAISIILIQIQLSNDVAGSKLASNISNSTLLNITTNNTTASSSISEHIHNL
ncbi:hypothetical protein M8J75_000700 [Diaphorina citri]|nr:hypothetical protein M8J75_000700 [Diaphorina citri]